MNISGACWCLGQQIHFMILAFLDTELLQQAIAQAVNPAMNFRSSTCFPCVSNNHCTHEVAHLFNHIELTQAALRLVIVKLVEFLLV